MPAPCVTAEASGGRSPTSRGGLLASSTPRAGPPQTKHAALHCLQDVPASNRPSVVALLLAAVDWLARHAVQLPAPKVHWVRHVGVPQQRGDPGLGRAVPDLRRRGGAARVPTCRSRRSFSPQGGAHKACAHAPRGSCSTQRQSRRRTARPCGPRVRDGRRARCSGQPCAPVAAAYVPVAAGRAAAAAAAAALLPARSKAHPTAMAVLTRHPLGSASSHQQRAHESMYVWRRAASSARRAAAAVGKAWQSRPQAAGSRTRVEAAVRVPRLCAHKCSVRTSMRVVLASVRTRGARKHARTSRVVEAGRAERRWLRKDVIVRRRRHGRVMASSAHRGLSPSGAEDLFAPAVARPLGHRR